MKLRLDHPAVAAALRVPSTPVPTSALVTAALLLAGPLDADSPLGRLTAPDVRALEAGGLTSDGRLREWAAALVELITWPELVAEVVRQRRHRPIERTIVWARSDAAVLGSPVEGTISLAPVDVTAVGQHLLGQCSVPRHDPPPADPALVADLLAALLTDDAPRVADAL